jgi:hypothetical protein
MSEEGGFGINFAEKFFGLLVFIIGVLALYYMLTSLQALGGFAGLFGFLNIVYIVLGLILITAKTE